LHPTGYGRPDGSGASDRGNEIGLGCGAPDRQKETEDRRALKRPTEIIKLEEVFLLNEIPLERGFFLALGFIPGWGIEVRPNSIQIASSLAMTPWIGDISN